MQADSVFWLAIGLIFFATLFGALARRLKKDGCLKIFHSHHVTCLLEGKEAITGDLTVTSRGIEIAFSERKNQQSGSRRTGMLVYENEFTVCTALCRCEEGLTEAEKRRRQRQVRRLVDPDSFHRFLRYITNGINVVRDAIIQSMGLFLGRFGARPGSLQTVAREQSTRLTELSGNVLGLFANAYEPLLERHIGHEVVLALRVREKPEVVEECFFGYLADYNERFIVLLNPGQAPSAQWDVEVDATLELAGCTLHRGEASLNIICTGSEPVVVRTVYRNGNPVVTGVVLLKFQSLTVLLVQEDRIRVCLERTPHVDLICPRSKAQVRFTASTRTNDGP